MSRHGWALLAILVANLPITTIVWFFSHDPEKWAGTGITWRHAATIAAGLEMFVLSVIAALIAISKAVEER